MNAVRLSLAHSLLAMALTGTVWFAASPAVAESSHGAGSQAALPKPWTGNFEQRFIRELRSNGMEVSVGYPRLYTQADCAFSYAVFHNCFGNNPASPYVMPASRRACDTAAAISSIEDAAVSAFTRPYRCVAGACVDGSSAAARPPEGRRARGGELPAATGRAGYADSIDRAGYGRSDD